MYFKSFIKSHCRCDAGWIGIRCESRANFSCPTNKYVCKIGNWSCVDKDQICSSSNPCDISPVDSAKICGGMFQLILLNLSGRNRANYKYGSLPMLLVLVISY